MGAKLFGATLIEIDGSKGEGGGQILRSALALSLATGKPMRMHHIRARRPKPGLRPQHLKSVEAAAVVGQAEVDGAVIGSSEITFRPRQLQAGNFHFDIGTAGATGLVLQTIFLPLSLVDAPSAVTITGGTHVRWSPCFHYLHWHWMPFMRKIGYDADLYLDLAGFYPQGGGQLRAVIRPRGSTSSLRLKKRGEVLRVRGLSAISNLPLHIAKRQREQTLRRLRGFDYSVQVDISELPSRTKGTLLILLVECEGGQACYFGLGERGKPAERVADEAVNQLLAFQESDGVIDEYLADQLLLPLAVLTGASEFRTSKVTGHLVTNAEVIRAFTAAQIMIEGDQGDPGWVRIEPSP
ncbi:MAG: RNA 3'-terminal phosphate cyclase [Anaerolineales bacterium]|nr:RNA 3'-terminal phosphate cyclase [Anaerolineales bacterium]